MKDATGFWEEDIESVAKEIVKTINEDGPKVMNRPLGSVPVPKEDQKSEWMLAQDNMDYWSGRMQALMNQGYGAEQAALKLLEFHEEMRGS